MLAQAKHQPVLPLGVYFHVPFCTSTCDFCGFYQEAPSRSGVERYLEAMEAELRSFPPGRGVETVFWGGGTPGVLSASAIERLGKALLERTSGTPVEWTVELAPATVTEAKLRSLRALGVTRISMGAQSFQPRLLEALGRQHSHTQILRAWELIDRVGFPVRNLDLIFAIPGQTPEALRADLDAALSLLPDSLSLYCLTFEEDTALFVRLSEGKVRQDPERDAELYELAWDHLQAAGLEHYEISNFCRSGKACLHNMRTWEMAEWLGFGPAAASQFSGWRWANLPELEGWAAGILARQPRRIDEMPLDARTLLVDALIFGLRLGRGIDLGDLEERFSSGQLKPYRNLLEALRREGLVEGAGSERRLTRRGQLLADAVAQRLLEVA